MAKSLSNVSLIDILPDSLLIDEELYAAAKALDDELARASGDIRECEIMSRIDELPEDVLTLLAWQWHVDFYDLALPLETKRNLIKSSIAVHRIKGTPAAVKDVLEMVYGAGEVKEWFNYDGTPYHFRVSIPMGDDVPTAESVATLRKCIKSVKNVRSQLDEIVFASSQEMPGMGLYETCTGALDISSTELNEVAFTSVKLSCGHYKTAVMALDSSITSLVEREHEPTTIGASVGMAAINALEISSTPLKERV